MQNEGLLQNDSSSVFVADGRMYNDKGHSIGIPGAWMNPREKRAKISRFREQIERRHRLIILTTIHGIGVDVPFARISQQRLHPQRAIRR